MIKLIILAFAFIFVTSCSISRHAGTMQPNYTVVADTETKVLKGYINRSVLEGDTAFKWFAQNMKYGTADASAVEAFKNNAAKFSLIVFGGTWCHDTQNLLPVFYHLIDKSGYPENKITLIAVDRAKTAPGNLQKTYNVTNVPTFIIMKDGKEAGRLVAYGKEGQIDKELGEIVSEKVSK